MSYLSVGDKRAKKALLGDELVPYIYLGDMVVYVGDGYEIITESTTWLTPAGVTNIDIFMIGGGGSSGPSRTMAGCAMCSGGGSGYTLSLLNQTVVEGQPVHITIGAGGSTTSASGIATYGKLESGNDGGDTIVEVNGTTYTANGGSAGKCVFYTLDGGSYDRANKSCAGGSGGSSGRSVGRFLVNDTLVTYNNTTPLDDGQCEISSFNGISMRTTSSQGTTTRAFGESNGTMYGKGGATYNTNNSADIPLVEQNTGNGGNGNIWEDSTSASSICNAGASGLVIIRWDSSEQG